MRLTGIAVFVTAMLAGVSAHPSHSPSALAGQAPSNMPKLVAPQEAKLVSSHGDRGPEAFGVLTGHATYRLQTTMSASAIADDYLRQLVAVGWNQRCPRNPAQWRSSASPQGQRTIH